MYDRYFAKNVKNAASKIICVSQGEMDYAIKSGFDRNKLIIVPDSVDISRFERKQKGAFKKAYEIDSDFVLYVGRLAKNKGLEYLIRAIPKVLKRYPDTKFVFIGEDEDMKNILLYLAKKFGIEQSILFTGALDFNMVTSAFLDCSLFVLPSEFEAFGIVAAEAQAARKPVVATRVGGVPNVVKDKETGLLVDYGNSNELALRIIDLLLDEDLRRRYGEAGYSWVKENFALEKVVDKLERVYNGILL
jgi:glycosyltransferase involved in cell wall biosynthesis